MESLNKMAKLYKFPRIYHVPWSPNLQNDDRRHPDMSIFEGREVVVTEKMDGENCLDENTLIDTEDGKKTIRWICETKYSGKVKSYNIETDEIKWNKILNWSILENINDWYEIELENGIIIILTGNERIWLPELMCYRRVDELNGNEEILLKK